MARMAKNRNHLVTMRWILTPQPSCEIRRRDCLLAGLGWLGTQSMGRAQSATLRIGLTPVFLDDRMRLLRQWAAYLEAAMGQPVRFYQFSAYAQVVDALRSGQLDFAWVCGYPFVLYRRDMHLVAVPQWRGRPHYQSYLIVDATSPAQDLDDLRHRTFAYSDPLSNSGFLYVQHLLRERRHNPSLYFSHTFFTYSHRHVVEAVSQGLAYAGAVDGYVWETLAELAPEVTARTRVLLRSPNFGFPPIVAPMQTPRALQRSFWHALQAMSSDRTGQDVLRDLRLDGFVAPTPGLFASIEAMTRQQT